MTSRRDFLKGAGAVTGGALLNGLIAERAAAENAAARRTEATQLVHTERAPAPLNILILGGTGFIGPHLVRALDARKHRVTIFTRGRRQPELPESIQKLTGDRDAKDANGQLAGNYDSLKGFTWDVVIDDSANNPAWVKQSTELLKGATSFYLFVSSTGVFFPYRTTNIDESVKVLTSMDQPDADSFGVAKAQAEDITRQAFGNNAIVVRPTYIVGPGDTSDRFTYWPVRLARGGEVLAPGKPTDPAQFIDVRDLAEFMVKLVEERKGGTYNVAGPKNPLLFPAFLEEAKKAVAPADTHFTWIDDYAFLAEQKLEFACPWGLPTVKGELGMMSINNNRALKAGLTFRPMALTVKDTLAWWQTLPEARRAKPRFVLTPEREAEILAAWKARGKK